MVLMIPKSSDGLPSVGCGSAAPALARAESWRVQPPALAPRSAEGSLLFDSQDLASAWRSADSAMDALEGAIAGAELFSPSQLEPCAVDGMMVRARRLRAPKRNPHEAAGDETPPCTRSLLRASLPPRGLS